MGPLGIFLMQDLNHLSSRGIHVQGTVVDEAFGRASRIKVTYTTNTGDEVTAETENFVDRDVGDTIPIIYDPEDPEVIQDERYGFGFGSYAFAALPSLIGLPLLVFGLYVAFKGMPRWTERWR